MVSRFVRFLCVTGMLFGVAGCGPKEAAVSAVGQDGWLTGTADKKMEIVAKQLRGFDVAMIETGYRFTELYFAGEDQNWPYAKYQAEKIGTAIQNGLERRPKRAASAETFLKLILPEVLDAIAQKDLALFRQRFHTMVSTCNTCHVNEKVEFISVVLPKQRLAPVGPGPE